MPTSPHARRAAVGFLLAVSTLTAATSASSAERDAEDVRADRHHGTLASLEGPADRALQTAMSRTGGARSDGSTETFIGIDGLSHLVSPVAIPGKDGYIYLGADFDTACAFGAHLRPAMTRLSRLANILEKAGKRVFFTVAPNKSVVLKGKLPTDAPQGACSRRGMNVQAKLLDRYKDPRYIPIREALVGAPHPYWRTDSHWNTIGTTVFAQHLALALDPTLARQQSYRKTKRTQLGDLSHYVPGVGAETEVARVPNNGVRTKPARGSAAYDPSLEAVHTELSWTSKPVRRTYPGRTLILGDSFTYVASEALTNLFRRGRFMWVGFPDSVEDYSSAIKKADTVVFSVVQRYATITPLADRAFQDELKALLPQGR
jgi:hypothetical protein